MIRDLSALARVFADAYGPGLDATRVEAALARVFEEERAESMRPRAPSHPLERRLDVAIARVTKATGYTSDELLSDHCGDLALSAAQDDLAYELAEVAGVSYRATAKLLRRQWGTVRRMIERSEERRAVVVGGMRVVGGGR